MPRKKPEGQPTRPVGRPREGKIYVNSNRKMELGMDVDIRSIVALMPEKYKSINQFVNDALTALILEEKKELYDRGEVDTPGLTIV